MAALVKYEIKWKQALFKHLEKDLWSSSKYFHQSFYVRKLLPLRHHLIVASEIQWVGSFMNN